ncbi:MAG: class I SAM-dependent methyltransferase [Ktedonobacterales bacterium]|nr:class I SAM-dependent methyltransferase [Ktedonobacterales bacterium]
MDPYIKGNQELWNEWADINYHSDFYDVAGFVAHPINFPEGGIIRAGVGDVAGKSLLHLQCHFGKDTLRFALLGAHVTGIDFSEQAIGYARELANRMQLPATFIQTALYDLPQHLTEQFDVVFTSQGVLGWLPDLQRWGQIVAQFLKPGGTFFILEGHPTMLMFDEESAELRLKYSYFHSDDPIVIEPHSGNYADPTATVTHREYSWQHSMADIVNALLTHGLQIEYLREYPFMGWQGFPALVQQDGEWSMPADQPQLPLSFAIRAHKPEV